jgi:hypothetical protein
LSQDLNGLTEFVHLFGGRKFSIKGTIKAKVKKWKLMHSKNKEARVDAVGRRA